jgi:diguanylate cyclase (GGDEF)-like protein
MLVEVARVLREGARDTDVVARIGGDEFAVLLADLDVREAPTLAQSVVERIQLLLSKPISMGPVELRADASIGVAIYPLDARNAGGLLRAADVDMYRSKTAAARVA